MGSCHAKGNQRAGPGAHAASQGAGLSAHVRQPWEHQLAALPGSTLIPLPELARRASEVRPSQGSALVVYCHHGMRSLSGAAILEQLGFENVASLAGGIDAWAMEVDQTMPRY
jgi:rhodanese-related sulfurtransferase